MAHYQLILAYDGTDFSGFQRQGKARTVQGVFEQSLIELGWQERAILFAGRTDTGVHATGQVVAFSIDWHHSSADLQRALNAKLPVDISVLRISKAEAEFHPRYDASSRTYRYRIYFSQQRLPLMERFAWRIWPALDVTLLNNAAGVFIGRHDFSAYGRAMKPKASTVREVYKSQWVAEETGCWYEVKANAFLYHMVRRLVRVQVMYAQGKILLEKLAESLEDGSSLNPGLAPSHGLVLTHVDYGEVNRGKVEMEENLE